jgi:NOT2/NOT3/NOT5 C-terminal
MSAPPSAQSKMQKFSDETLFYIFYAMPGDVLQDCAAYELLAPIGVGLTVEHVVIGDIIRGFRCG